MDDYLDADPVLAAEIRQKTGVVWGVDDAEGDEDVDDDLDPAISFADVVRNTLDLDLDIPDDPYTSRDVRKVGNGLSVAGSEENVWAYDDFGRQFGKDTDLPMADEASDADGMNSQQKEFI